MELYKHKTNKIGNAICWLYDDIYSNDLKMPDDDTEKIHFPLFHALDNDLWCQSDYNNQILIRQIENEIKTYIY